MPAGPDSPGGLSRSAWELAVGLAGLGHAVSLIAAPGSVPIPGGALLRWGAPLPDADAYLDCTHAHNLSFHKPDAPVVNRMGDLECGYTPPNAVVATGYMQRRYPTARRIRTGIARAPVFSGVPGTYLLFMALNAPHKGLEAARAVARAAGYELREYGERTRGGVLTGMAKWDALAGAYALLYPSWQDAGPRTPIEAALTGTPTLCLDNSGAADHVQHCVSGFVCADEAEMVDALADVPLLNRDAAAAWARDTHDYPRMMDGYEAALASVAQGERW